MKRILAVALIFVLLLTAVGCGGKNGEKGYHQVHLDALYDCLTEVHEPVQITLQNLDSLMNYGKKLLRVLQDAAVENENIHVLIEEAAD